MMALKGIRVIEMAGLAPVPFCGMVLADFGASVTRIDRKPSGKSLPHSMDTLCRGKQSVSVNLKHPDGVGVVRRLCSNADVLIEPFRPGVMEKLGLGPDKLMADNPRLVYARLTGFGQEGPLAKKAGHDVNYIAISGVLGQLGREHENPAPPINLVADFGGGGLMCALGITMALLERQGSGKGQIIDANMVNGSAYLSSFLWTTRDMMIWPGERGQNLLDGGQAFYETYRTKDNRFMSVGCLEPQFYADLLKGLGLTKDEMPQYTEPDVMKKRFTEIFATKTRDEWTTIFSGLDACVEPILDMHEAANHPHNVAIQTFMPSADGNVCKSEPAPAPRLSRTPATMVSRPRPEIGQHTENILVEHGYSTAEIEQLKEADAVYQNPSVEASKL